MAEILFENNRSGLEEIILHLKKNAAAFVPPLDTYTNIETYGLKLFEKSTRIEGYSLNEMVALAAFYFDANGKTAFLSNFSVDAEYFGRGIAVKLLNKVVEHLKKKGCKCLDLEVSKLNTRATGFYTKSGFEKISENETLLTMQLPIQRNYEEELKDSHNHKYAYQFDMDVMHPFMIKSFEPHFRYGNALELGSFKGEFTKRLFPFFNDITCVEASTVAIEHAMHELGDRVKFRNAVFEQVELNEQYNNIILTHVLEHLDDPVFVLKRVNDEWLSDTGRLFLVCPNANAPSRQIAVKMGLISHNAAITPAEAEHGHRITYSLDTLERDAKAAGLKVIHRSGIFFKALANFQWDQLLQTDIISPAYLEGCYQLGQVYPDLCSSIFLLCEKGDQ